MEIGYHLSSEEHRPNALVANATRAEEAGFTCGIVSDHFHPWIDAHGQSPFVWSVFGGIAREPVTPRASRAEVAELRAAGAQLVEVLPEEAVALTLGDGR